MLLQLAQGRHQRSPSLKARLRRTGEIGATACASPERMADSIFC